MRSMASSSSSRGIAAIVGVGPNLGLSIARKFAHEGYTVAILARDLGISLTYTHTHTQILILSISIPIIHTLYPSYNNILSYYNIIEYYYVIKI